MRKNLVAADYVGIVSGHDVPDKMEKSGFHTVKSEFVDAPVIEELPISLECRVDERGGRDSGRRRED